MSLPSVNCLPPPHPTVSRYHFLIAEQLSFFPRPSLLHMNPHSGSSRFRALFDVALRDYEKTTNITLAKHPIAEQLQNCHTVEPIMTLLQGQARELGDFPGSDKMMESIKNTISVLCMLGDTAALGDAINLVRPKVLMGVFHH